LIYVRSRRSIVTLGAIGLVCALVFAVLAAGAMLTPSGWVAAVALGAGSAGGLAAAVWAVLQLRSWPWGKLGFFRDRMLVIQGRHEMRALWSLMDTVTLSDPNSWPSVRLTDRLTIHFRNEPPLGFKPAQFGLQPAACRDLILRLRDDARLRARLPEFDSVRDLAVSPVVAGELIEPRL
jgi:ABC-type antimicrobial peptide transport system permease subunit